MVKKENLHHLRIESTDSKAKIMLDGKELKHVKKFGIESSDMLPGTAELSVRIWVQYP